MTAYVLKRLVYVIAVLAIMSVLIFLATHSLPENTAQVILGQYWTPETQAALEAKLGLDRPLVVQYVEWAGRLLHGDLGQSLIMERPIAPLLLAALGSSAILASTTMVFLTVLGVGLGVLAAVKRGGISDHLASLVGYVGISIPEFFWGLLLILIFSSYLGWLPTSGIGSLEEGPWSLITHLILPVVALTITLLAHVSRLTRSTMLEVLDSAYVKAARARGLPEWLVIWRHALRNAMLPTITVLAHDFGFLIGGIVAIESIFAYPGLGRLLVFSLERHDQPLMQAAILVLTLVYCLANLVADLLYTAFNPRIRYGRTVD
jgi:peptide/nickel transport system permease protein